jgi:hypothetical protein
VFTIVTTCSEIARHFGRTYRLYLQGRRIRLSQVRYQQKQASGLTLRTDKSDAIHIGQWYVTAGSVLPGCREG